MLIWVPSENESATVDLHQPSGRWRLGLALTLLTVLLWATQPVAFKIALEQVDAMTLVWARVAFAGLTIGGWLAWRGQWRGLRGLDRGTWLLLGAAGFGLLGNFLCYMLGLRRTSPGIAQLLAQVSHPLVALGAILLFRERFNRWQWTGIGAIGLGLALFCAGQPHGGPQPADARNLWLGVGLVMLASAVWPVYALAQKQLLRTFSSVQIIGFICAFMAVAFLPAARPAALLALDRVHWAAAGYCLFTTVAAYLAFSEAFEHWEASRVSTLCTISPLLTVLAVAALHRLAPGLIRPERFTTVGCAGGLLIVGGSALSSLMRTR
jgi:drug/metabolite transporter (DMT)-like permease